MNGFLFIIIGTMLIGATVFGGDIAQALTNKFDDAYFSRVWVNTSARFDTNSNFSVFGGGILKDGVYEFDTVKVNDTQINGDLEVLGSATFDSSSVYSSGDITTDGILYANNVYVTNELCLEAGNKCINEWSDVNQSQSISRHRLILSAGSRNSYTATSYMESEGRALHTDTHGWKMINDGSVVGFSYNTVISWIMGSGTIKAEVRHYNGTTQTLINTTGITINAMNDNGINGEYLSREFDKFNFKAGDLLMVRMLKTGGTFNYDEAIATVMIETT